MLEESVRRIDAFRDAHPEHPIVDVQYDDLMRIRSATVAVDLRGGWATSSTTRGAQRDDGVRRRASARAQFGVHGYDLAEFGLDAGELAERFSGYVDRYDVPREH